MKKDIVSIERRAISSGIRDLKALVDSLAKDVEEGFLPEDFHVTNAIISHAIRVHGSSVRLLAYKQAGLVLPETPPSCDGGA